MGYYYHCCVFFAFVATHSCSRPATIARPGGPSRLRYSGLLLPLLCLLRICCHTLVLSPFLVCVGTRPPLFCPSRICLALPVTVMLRHAHSRVLAADDNQCRVKGCRTAARVSYVRSRARAHTVLLQRISRVAHTTNAVCPQILRHYTSIYEESAMIAAVFSKNFAGNFNQDFFPEKS